MHEELEGVGAEDARRLLDLGVDLLDEGDHHQDDEGDRRHEVRQHDARHLAGEAGLVEHRRQRDAEGDRRHQQRQQEEQHDELLAGEVPPRQRIGRRHADQARQRHHQEDDLKGDEQHVMKLELRPGGGIPPRRPAGRQPGAEPARGEGRGHHRRDHREEVDDEEADQRPVRGRPELRRETGVFHHGISPFRRQPGRDRAGRAPPAPRRRWRAAPPP